MGLVFRLCSDRYISVSCESGSCVIPVLSCRTRFVINTGVGGGLYIKQKRETDVVQLHVQSQTVLIYIFCYYGFSYRASLTNKGTYSTYIYGYIILLYLTPYH